MATEEVIVSLENRPGTLADALETLAEEGINIEGISLAALGPFGTARILAEDPDGVFTALEKAGVPATRREVNVVTLPNQPGELARVARTLGDSGVNIEGIFANASEASEGQIVIETDDPAGARKALDL